jgi:hypothetical protein
VHAWPGREAEGKGLVSLGEQAQAGFRSAGCAPEDSPGGAAADSSPARAEEPGNPERMEQDTHLTWLCGGAAVPLTVFAQRTRTTTADAGSIDHAQASIRFPAPLLGDQGLLCWTAQRPVRLEGKILPPEATSFPGGPHLRRSIAGGRSGGC